MEEFFILLLIFALLTVIGHGIWVLIAFVFRGFRGKREPERTPTVQDDRIATARYLTHLESRGLLGEAERRRLMSLIADEANGVAVAPVATPTRSALDTIRELREREASARREPIPESQTTLPTTREDVVAPASDPVAPPLVLPSASDPPPTVTAPLRTEPPAPLKPVEPKRPFSAVLAAFMAEKNIRWGEIIGGLLIVSCSTALVISLWAQIEAIPILKFLIFCGVTAAISGAGLFVFHRWKLPTTGHALLVISTLLVPLNLLAFAAFTRPGDAGSLWTLGAEILATAIFAWLTWLAGKVIMPRAPVLLAIGVVALALTTPLIRFVGADGGGFVGALIRHSPAVVYLLIMGLAFGRWLRDDAADATRVRELLLQLGVQSFAGLVAIGFLVYQFGDVRLALRDVSPLLCAMSAPALFIGLYLWRRYAGPIAVSERLIAITSCLIGAAILVGCSAIAWPAPSRLLPVLLVNVAVMATLAGVTRYRVFHALALGWSAAAAVMFAHLALGRIAWSAIDSTALLQAINSVISGIAMLPVALAGLAIAVWFDRRKSTSLADAYQWSAVAVIAISTALVSAHGFAQVGDPERVTWIYLVYAGVSFVATIRLRSAILTWCGQLALLLGAAQWLVYAKPIESFAWPTSLLVVASVSTLGAAAAAVMRRGREVWNRAVKAPMLQFGLIVSSIALIWTLVEHSGGSLAGVALRAGWTGAMWIVIAALLSSAIVMSLAQVALYLAGGVAMTSRLSQEPWFADAGVWSPRVFQWNAAMVAGASLVWSFLRLGLGRMSPANPSPSESNAGDSDPSMRARTPLSAASRLLNPSYPAMDRVAGWAALMVGVGLAAWALLPAIVSECGGAMAPEIAGLRAHAAEWGSWAVLALLGVLMIARGLERRRAEAIICSFGCLFAICALAAARFEGACQATLAWRWIGALVCLVSSLLVVEWWGSGEESRRSSHLGDILSSLQSSWFVQSVFAIPVIVATAAAANAMASGVGSIAAPASDVGIRFWMIGPIVVIAAGLIGFSVSRGVRVRYVILAALLLCCSVTSAEETLRLRNTQGAFPDFVWLVQLNAIVFAGVILTWRAILALRRVETDHARDWTTRLLFALRIANGAVLLLAAAAIAMEPVSLSSVVTQAGSLWSVLAIGLTEFAIFVAGAREKRPHAGRHTIWLLYAAVVLSSSVSALNWDSGRWETYHALMVALCLAGGLRLIVGQLESRRFLGAGLTQALQAAAEGPSDSIGHDLACVACGYNLRTLDAKGACPECGERVSVSKLAAIERLSPEWSARWRRLRATIGGMTHVCLILVALLVIRAAIDDPQAPWWSAGACLVMCGIANASAVWEPRRAFAFVGAIALCLGASLVWRDVQIGALSWSSLSAMADLVSVNIAALAAAAIAWIWVERKFLRPKLADREDDRPYALHQFAATAGVVLLAMIAGAVLGAGFTADTTTHVGPIVWAAWGAVTLLLLICAIKREFVYAWAGLYVIGLAGIALATVRFQASAETLALALSLEASAYALLVATCLRRRLSETGTTAGLTWLAPAQVALMLASCGLALFACMTSPLFAMRALAGLAPLMCAVGACNHAGRESGRYWLTFCVHMVGLGVLTLSLSMVNPEAGAQLYLRSLLAAVAMWVMIVIAAILTGTMAPGARMLMAMRPAVMSFSGVAAAGLAFVMTGDIRGLLARSAPELAPAIQIIFIAVGAVFVVGLLFAAMRERFDPWRTPMACRGAHVYGAEVLAAMLGVHIRATAPWLFSGFLTQYWPVIVMGLAFLAMFASELLERRNAAAISSPLGRTGLFLPALALLEFFVASSSVHYTIVLIAAGTFYAVVASLRRSMGFGLVASFLFTGALWYWLHQTETLNITQHPQLWIIPPALAVLVAGHLSRDRLTEGRQKGINYGCLIAIYVSSTADVFLIGVASAPWLPLVLGGLSVAGLLVGIAFHVRSFLQLGTAFLGVSLVTIIWYAAEDLGWTWVWYVAGIALGAMIITLFALFEKKRSEMTAMLREMREWRG